MHLYVMEEYREYFPDIKGSELTDKLIKEAVLQYGFDDVKVCRTDKGKPYLKLPESENELFVSVSHSKDVFACLLCDKPVGVDIQHERKANSQNISRRYFTKQEQEYVEKYGNEAFFRIWTRKEAYAKYTGRGLEEIIKGTCVMDRTDVEFTDFMLEEGLYCSCCIQVCNENKKEECSADSEVKNEQ